MSVSDVELPASPKRPCADCGYDLSAHAPGAICPECGVRSAEREYIAVESIDERRQFRAAEVVKRGLIQALLWLPIGLILLLGSRTSFQLLLGLASLAAAFVAGCVWFYLRGRVGRPNRGADAATYHSLHIMPDGYCFRSGTRSRRYRWSDRHSVHISPKGSFKPGASEDTRIPVEIRIGNWLRSRTLQPHMTATEYAEAADQIRAIVPGPYQGRPSPKLQVEPT